ncbi:hypothetical protein GH714_018896 [Hevea brasiliensis]|uniref:non-specific serine/threonine protein kinase n=1 Tax=Hevea brasiliensis TaxID=3981 RepID=A0A6A6LTR3_HEVBR|nr:hypothetical protein GH714_018896 [Hevea brasiliensis]
MLNTIFFSCVFILCFSLLNSFASDTISSNGSLTDGETLISAEKRFELGFFTPAGSSDTKRYVGIWYYGLDPITVIWVANRNKPLSDVDGSFAVHDGNLTVLDKSGNLFWSTELGTPSPRYRRYWEAKLLDSGNLVLRNQLAIIIWQSFQNPTDTFISGMKMDQNITLTSWTSQVDPAPGKFKFNPYEDDKNQFIIWNGPFPYWRSGVSGEFFSTDEVNSTVAYLLFNFKKMFGLTGFKPQHPEDWNKGEFSGGCNRKSTSCGKNDIFLNLKMMKVANTESKYDVNETKCREECLRECRCQAYSYTEGNSSRRDVEPSSPTCWIWTEDLSNLQEDYHNGHDLFVRVARSDIESTSRNCEACGTNLIPYPLSTGSNCGDPMYKNFYCNNSTGKLNFKVPTGTYDVTSINPITRTFVIQAKEADNCNARNSEILYLDQSLPFKVINEIHYCTDEKKDEKKTRENIERNAALLYGTEKRIKDLMGCKDFKEEDKKGIDVPFFNLDSILAATDNFSDANKLGRGGFGPVYKGIFPGGQEIAIKRLSSVSGQGLEEFKNEVVLIAKLQHRNLVRLLGYCIHGNEKILLYEYMPNRSLDSFYSVSLKRSSSSSFQGKLNIYLCKPDSQNHYFLLFLCMENIPDEKLGMLLNWEVRFNIIIGVARGLVYLHQDSRLRIIHRDLKTSNILLDAEMNPKISDFGLARIFEGKQTEGSTNRVVGTYGYMSPEYALDGLFSVKSDAFSFGVVVLEILSGRRSTGVFKPEQALNLLSYAWRLWREDKALDFIDKTMSESCNSNGFLKCLRIALLCVQEDPADRPDMSYVIVMLNSDTATFPAPKQPAFVEREVTAEEKLLFRLVKSLSLDSLLLMEAQEGDIGIWYYMSNPLTVVWVANRDNPLLDYDGVFSMAEDGNLKILDGRGRSYWSTNLGADSSVDRQTKLMDTGNLVVSDGDGENHLRRTLWQSFDNPTDTFLPGMKMNEDMALVSWKSYDDPASGNFTFQLDQEADQFVIWKRSIRYWRSGVSGKVGSSSEMPSSISYFLSNFTSTVAHNDSVPYITSSLYIDTRMIMSFSGQIQYLKWDTQKIWTLFWAMPRKRCSLYNACGNFGSCNSNNELVCKCLPGFQPISPEYWNSGDYSGGAPGGHHYAAAMLQAFSYEEAEITQQGESGSAKCWIWLEDLSDLQEEYDGGRNLNVRISVSDIDLTSRNCGTCGANIIPYPLSTGPNCGDPYYFNFYCNISTGQLNFQAPGGTYRVTKINSQMRKFVIQTNDVDSCKAINSNTKFLLLNQSSPFHVIRWCMADLGNYTSDASFTGRGEVEVSWDPPPEPTCSSPTDCKDWPNSTCQAPGDRKKKCLCNMNFRWDCLRLNCTQEGYRKQKNKPSIGKIPASLIVAVAFASVIGLVVLSSTIIFMYLQRRRLAIVQGNRGTLQRHLGLHLYNSERLVKDIIDSGRFKEDETKAMDVRYFDLESILAATNKFSNSNKLGQGGFGPVYKATFPGGEEIAVKRLSSGSGQGLQEFKNEIVLIAKLQHRNLVRLLGYCVEGDEKMLLYEYMPNKSLDSFIFDRKLRVTLDWGMRYSIILGIARGLLYLHQDSRLRIIHRDLKTSNILLDEEMNPKISDFGLARIFGGKETAANTTRVVGTYGYIAPEYALDGLFSFKSDVFSFGVVVLEIISGKRNIEDPCDRPTMSNVLLMLGSETASLPGPKQPAFVVRRCPSSRASSSGKPETCSNNELTVTLEDGR